MRKSVKPPAELKKKVFSLKQRRLPNFFKGIEAEKLALAFLENKGYVLLEKNLRLGNCEIDIIALDRQFDEIVFIEVKYLAKDDFGDASQAVDQKKLKNMIKVASSYLRNKQFKKSHRFDIISIIGKLDQPRVEHFENVTWL